MPRIGLAYDPRSRVSLTLIAGFSLALVVMASWLVMMIMSSSGTESVAADPADDAALGAPPRVENTVPPYVPPVIPGGVPPSGEAPMAGAPGAASGLLAAAPGAAATSALAVNGTALGGPGDLLNLDAEPAAAAPQMVPLPPPRPRRIAAVPTPRPRPRLNDGEAQPPREWSLFDLFAGQH